MSATAATAKRERSPDTDTDTRTAGALLAHQASIVHAPVPGIHPHGRGGTILFEIPFTTVTGDADLALLARLLDLSTHMYPKMDFRRCERLPDTHREIVHGPLGQAGTKGVTRIRQHLVGLT